MMLNDLDSYMQKNETQSPTYTIHKNKLKWIKDLNVSHDTIKVLKENVGREISGNPCSNIFTVMSPRTRDIKERIKKEDFIKIKKASVWLKKTSAK